MNLQVKFFGSSNPLKTTFFGKELFFDDVEREINTWLLAHPNIEIVEIKHSCSGGSLVPTKLIVSVWYRNKT